MERIAMVARGKVESAIVGGGEGIDLFCFFRRKLRLSRTVLFCFWWNSKFTKSTNNPQGWISRYQILLSYMQYMNVISIRKDRRKSIYEYNSFEKKSPFKRLHCQDEMRFL